MKEKNHLPVIGVGPFIVIPQILLTIAGIIVSGFGYLDFARIESLKFPFFILGILLIVGGIYLWFSANYKEKLFDGIVENRLITTGVYMTVFLINTEEKWLRKQYGQEYENYCKKVNRCIPWFSKE